MLRFRTALVRERRRADRFDEVFALVTLRVPGLPVDAAGAMLAAANERGVDMTAAHELAYRLFAIAEKRGMTDIGIIFNTLGSAWADVRAEASSPALATTRSGRAMLDLEGLDG